jgi:hypothetical protein
MAAFGDACGQLELKDAFEGAAFGGRSLAISLLVDACSSALGDSRQSHGQQWCTRSDAIEVRSLASVGKASTCS